jgi:hypothetical protein
VLARNAAQRDDAVQVFQFVITHLLFSSAPACSLSAA